MDYFEHTGIKYEGETVNDEPHGYGRMTLPDGKVYTGNFNCGQFHGEGELQFPDGRIMGKWDNGTLLSHEVFFSDNLQFHDEKWDYITPEDRRFYSEVTGAVPVAVSRVRPDQFPDDDAIIENRK